MKHTKRIVSIILVLILTVSVMVIAVPTASAATNTVTAFKNGKLVKAGNYYFAAVSEYDKQNGAMIYRIKSNGSSPKVIAKNVYTPDIYTYKNKVFFSNGKKIYSYDAKKLKATVLKKTELSIKGICSAGLITATSNQSLYLLSYKGKFKKIAGNDHQFLAANNKYIFYTKGGKTTLNDQLYQTARVKRYTIKTGANKNMGTFTAAVNGIGDDISSYTSDFHVFKNTIVYIYGAQAGTAHIFVGSLFAMKANGTGIKKLKDDVESELMPGKNCVYAKDSNGTKPNLYKVSSSGKISTQVKNTKIISTTAGNYSLSAIAPSSNNIYDSNRDLYVNTAVNAKKGKRVINSQKFISSSDSSDTYATCSVPGSVGNVALVKVDVLSASGGMGWRPLGLRTNVYLLNVKSRKTYRVDK